MHYRMRLEHLKRLVELLSNYIWYEYVGRESPENDKDGYALRLITADYLLTIRDGNGCPYIVLDPTMSSYDDESLLLIGKALANLFSENWKLVG